MLIGRRMLSAVRYFLNYPVQVKPFLPPGTFVQPPTDYTGPYNFYGAVRRQLKALGLLQWVRRVLGLRVIMTLRHFFTYSAATPSEAHFLYVVTEYSAPSQQYEKPNENELTDSQAEIGVNLVGYLRSEKGLGQAARNLLACAEYVNAPFAAYSIDIRNEAATVLTSPAPIQPRYGINVINVNADQVFQIEALLGKSFYRGRYNIGYWFWELKQFPTQWIGAYELYDEIWVASQFVKNSIQAHTTKPVTLMPMAIEVALPETQSRADFGLPNDAFIVLYMFDALGTFERKNPYGVIEAFRQAFDQQQRAHDVRLVIKATNLRAAPREAEQMLKLLEEVNGILIEQPFTRLEANALINQCDAYISLHRSEGYGLTMAEAMYLGKPVIATAYSGNLDFMTKDNSYLVPYQLVELKQHHGLYEQNNQWASPEIPAAAEYLRTIYANREQAALVGHKAAQHIRQEYNRIVIGRQISQHLASIHKESSVFA